MKISIARCFTGRRWLSLDLKNCNAWFSIGFGPGKFIERIYWRGRLVWFYKLRTRAHRGET